MSQNSDRLSYDEEADTQTVAPRWIKPGEGFEHSRHPVPGNTDSGVIYVDTDALAGAAATWKNAATRLRVLDGVVDQVPQNGAEKQRIALNHGAGWGRTNAKPLLLSLDFVLASSLLQQGADPHRH